MGGLNFCFFSWSCLALCPVWSLLARRPVCALLSRPALSGSFPALSCLCSSSAPCSVRLFLVSVSFFRALLCLTLSRRFPVSLPFFHPILSGFARCSALLVFFGALPVWSFKVLNAVFIELIGLFKTRFCSTLSLYTVFPDLFGYFLYAAVLPVQTL